MQQSTKNTIFFRKASTSQCSPSRDRDAFLKHAQGESKRKSEKNMSIEGIVSCPFYRNCQSNTGGKLGVANSLILFLNSSSYKEKRFKLKKISKFTSIIIGSILGFISGVVGIGGGIFLSPILFLLKVGYPKQIATTASIFILINSFDS